MLQISAVGLLVLLAAGCSGGVSLLGDGDDRSRDDAATDDAADAVPDVSDDAADDGPDETTPDGACCTPPMALDPASGTCISTAELRRSCDGAADDVCGFGQLCTMEWGEGPIGSYCHIPCDMTGSMLCPTGFVCMPAMCCDIPALGCAPDPCVPPLLGHPGTGACVSPEGVGRDCTIGESCGAGQTCLGWYDYGGVEHWTCELECAGNPALCPNGFSCSGEVLDGPSNICQIRRDLRSCDDPGAQVCGFPEKFADDLTRAFVCRGCYGVVLCADLSRDGTLGLLQTLAPGIDCSSSPGVRDCGDGLTACLLSFRSGIDDCPDGHPSDTFWTRTCLAAQVEAVRSVHCYWLE
jgi:hypothetical protein